VRRATRQKCCTLEDENKLLKLAEYVNSTIDFGVTFNPKNMQMEAYIDASFNIHSDAKGQSGIVLTMENNSSLLFAKSQKQKLTGRSSAESELFAFHTGAPMIVYTRQQLAEFGYKQEPTVVYQDNLSTIALAQQGEGNFGRTKHIALRYFCMKDLIDQGEIVTKHLGTKDMIADNLTKATTGSIFMRNRERIHNESANAFINSCNSCDSGETSHESINICDININI